MRIPFLLVCAAASALAGCGNGAADVSNGANGPSIADPAQVSDRDLEQQVMAALDDAPRNGLTRDLFLGRGLPPDKAKRRQALLQIAMDYASALASGKTDPAKLHDVYTLTRPKADIAAGVGKALSRNEFRPWVESLAPQTPEYRALSDAFVRLVQRSPDLPDETIPAGRAIRIGDKDQRVPLIAHNLQALGYLPPDDRQQRHSGTAFTRAMSQALRRFQSDSGLKPDGSVGPDTLDALNSGPRDRARTLAVAMERLRWLDRDPPAIRIDVNTAGSTLDYYRGGQLADRRKVIEGEPGKETPQIEAPIYELVANPTWTVPHSIDDEIAGKSSAWLADNGFTRKDGRWVQQSGPKNSLGLVKFDMKDDQAIYLHDTPARAIFALDERHRSHGCVRVEDALGFAHMLAAADGIDGQFGEAMDSGTETFVKLVREIPVRLMYHTAWLGEDGRVHFAADVYGWDNEIAAALGYPATPRAAVKQSSTDIGP